MRTCLILLSRSPAEGPVKTRLGKAISQAWAQEIYACFLQDLGQTLGALGLPCQLFYTPNTPKAKVDLAQLLALPCAHFPQGEGPLEERMHQAFETCFARGFEAAILIGGDLPDLPLEHLQVAAEALETGPWALGPSLDGGYYLLACRRAAYRPQILNWSAMNSEQLARETQKVLESWGESVRLLPPWQDVDTLADLKALCLRHATSNSVLRPQKTLHWLAEHELF